MGPKGGGREGMDPRFTFAREQIIPDHHARMEDLSDSLSCNMWQGKIPFRAMGLTSHGSMRVVVSGRTEPQTLN